MLTVMLRKTVCMLVLCLLFAGSGAARQVARISLLGLDYVSADDVARNLGTVATRLGSSVVLRTDFGILTLFEGEADYLWLPGSSGEPEERRLSVPPQRRGDTMWVPLELLTAIGATVSGVVVIMPDRTRMVLSEPGAMPATAAAEEGLEALPAPPPGLPAAGTEQVDLANGVSALRLSTGSQSVLITDLGLLSLVQPEQRSSFDEFMKELSDYRPLYFVITAATEGSYSTDFRIQQGSLVSELRIGNGVVLLQGDPDMVAPGQPVSGVLLLPQGINLRASVQVQWQQRSAGMIFRR